MSDWRASTRILWLRCYVNNLIIGSVGESRAIRMMISDISNAQNQLYKYIAANVHFSPLYRSSIIKMFL